MDRKYGIVINYIHSLVVNSSETGNTRIPPERELMSILNVSRSTVREALIILEHCGFITNQKKKGGRFIAEDYRKKFFKPLNTFVNLFEESNYNQLLEVKAMLVKECVFLAHKKMTEEDKISLQQILDSLQTLNCEDDCFIPQSIEIWNRTWIKIYNMSQNEPLMNLVESFSAFIGNNDEAIQYDDENGMAVVQSYCLGVNEFHKKILTGILTDRINLSLSTIEQNYVTSHMENLKIKGRIN